MSLVGGSWLIGALRVEDGVDAEVDARIGPGLRLVAWRLPDEGTDDAHRVVARVARAVSKAEGALLAVGSGQRHAGTLLGWTAAAVERRALRDDVWVARPVLSARLRAWLETMGELPDALELRARARPSEAALAVRWGRSLVATGRYAEAARALETAYRRAPEETAIDALPALADVHLRLADPAAATRWARRALRAIQSDTARAELQRLLAVAAMARGDLAAADRALAEVEQAAARLHDEALIARVRPDRIACVAALGRSDEADLLAWAGGARRPAPFAVVGSAAGPRWRASARVQAEWAVSALGAGAFDDAAARWAALADGVGWPDPVASARRARIGAAWTALLSRDIAAARSLSARQADDPALTTDERVVAAYVAAEAAWADGDGEAAGQLLGCAEHLLDEGAGGDLGGRPGATQLAWMIRALRARHARGCGDRGAAERSAEDAIARIEVLGGAPVGRWAPLERIVEQFAPYSLAAALAAEDARWDRTLGMLEARQRLVLSDGAPWRASLLPRGPVEPVMADALGALAAAGVAAVTVACAEDDVLVVPHGAGRPSRIAGGGARLRALADACAAAGCVRTALAVPLAEIAALLGPALRPLARGTGPLVVVPHLQLRAVPWEQVAVDGRALGALRPVLEAPSLALVGGDAPTPRPSLALLGDMALPEEATRGLRDRGFGIGPVVAGGIGLSASPESEGALSEALRQQLAGLVAPRVAVPASAAEAVLGEVARAIGEGLPLVDALRAAQRAAGRAGAVEPEAIAAFRVIALRVDIAAGVR